MSDNVIFYSTIVKAGMFSCIIGFMIRVLILRKLIRVLLRYMFANIKLFDTQGRLGTGRDPSLA